MNKAADHTTTLEHLKELIRVFCKERDWDQFHNPKDLAIGLTVEAGELLELFRYKTEKDSTEILQNLKSREKLSDELADCLYFVLRFADRFDFDLATALQTKMKKNATKYPVEKAKGSNLKYDEL